MGLGAHGRCVGASGGYVSVHGGYEYLTNTTVNTVRVVGVDAHGGCVGAGGGSGCAWWVCGCW